MEQCNKCQHFRERESVCVFLTYETFCGGGGGFLLASADFKENRQHCLFSQDQYSDICLYFQEMERERQERKEREKEAEERRKKQEELEKKEEAARVSHG